MILLIIGLILGAVTIIFAAQNTAPITVSFLTWQFHGPLALVIALAVISGILICAFLSWPDTIRKRFIISKLRNKNEELKEEIVNKENEVEAEKSKVAATNAYLDSLEKTPKV